jgi:hypothetical protein
MASPAGNRETAVSAPVMASIARLETFLLNIM